MIAARPAAAATMNRKSPAMVPITAAMPALLPWRAVASRIAMVPAPGMAWNTRMARIKLP
ncbi:hypothetical protein D3C78_1869480 [compost metagenome]